MLRLTVIAVMALALASPASAQFGGLKKKIKAKAGQDTTQPAGTSDPAAASAADPAGGTVVLTADVVDRMLAGLKAGQAERVAAAKEDTPYGRYEKGKAAYASAKPTCEAAQATFPQRAAANQKMADKYSALTEKMVKAQEKGDMKLMVIYQDSAMAMMDPSCVVKEPKQPDDYYEAQRAIDARAENQELKTSGMSRSELAMAKERTTAILQSATPPGDASAAEKSAVAAKASELKPLLGLAEAPAARAMKTAPAPAPVPAAATAPAPVPDPQVSASAQSMNDCMTKNMMSHQKEMEALGKQAQAAQAAGDNAKMMAIADSMQQIQMAGCQGR